MNACALDNLCAFVHSCIDRCALAHSLVKKGYLFYYIHEGCLVTMSLILSFIK